MSSCSSFLEKSCMINIYYIHGIDRRLILIDTIKDYPFRSNVENVKNLTLEPCSSKEQSNRWNYSLGREFHRFKNVNKNTSTPLPVAWSNSTKQMMQFRIPNNWSELCIKAVERQIWQSKDFTSYTSRKADISVE